MIFIIIIIMMMMMMNERISSNNETHQQQTTITNKITSHSLLITHHGLNYDDRSLNTMCSSYCINIRVVEYCYKQKRIEIRIIAGS